MSDGYSLDEQGSYKLRLVMRLHLEIFSRHLPFFTPTPFSILARLFLARECSRIQRVRMLAMNVATTKGVTARFTERGLVDVDNDRVDFRRLKILPTKVGLDLIISPMEKAKKITVDIVANLRGRDIQKLP